MKNSLMKTTLGILAVGLMATGAQAGWGHEGYGHEQAYLQTEAYGQQINARQERQMERIHAGMRRGQLTRAEFRELMEEQHAIRAMERHFRADGWIGAREFRRLERALDLADFNIRAEKHDDQARQVYGHASRFD